MRRIFFACLLLMAGTAQAQTPVTQVMIVAMFHMANPGRDLYDIHADDVLAPARQAQIQAVTDDLARFRPTVVAVEWPKDVADKRYAAYLAGTLKPSRDETVQLGFRLAKAARLKSVYGIDYMADFPYEAVQKYADAHGQAALLKRLDDDTGTMVAHEDAVLHHGTIADELRLLSSPAETVRAQNFYREVLRIGGGDNQPGAALLTAWFGRNAQICARLVQALKPGDRAVVMFGAGHAFYLRQCVREMPGFKLVDAEDYLRR